jgi:uncharacterized membrane protein
MLRTDASCQEQHGECLELLSNLSLTFDRLAGVFLVLSAVTLIVALLPTLMGYWPIFVIALIHLAIVGWCFRLAWRGFWRRQHVCITDEEVTLTDCSASESRTRRWPTGWVRVEIDRSGAEPRLLMAMHGERVELGAFAPVDERLEAADWLRSALQPRSLWTGSIPQQPR